MAQVTYKWSFRALLLIARKHLKNRLFSPWRRVTKYSAGMDLPWARINVAPSLIGRYSVPWATAMAQVTCKCSFRAPLLIARRHLKNRLFSPWRRLAKYSAGMDLPWARINVAPSLIGRYSAPRATSMAQVTYRWSSRAPLLITRKHLKNRLFSPWRIVI